MKIERFFERPDPRGARSKYLKRRVVEAILYRLREGCRWRALPHDLPPWDTVYDHLATLAKARCLAGGRGDSGHPLARGGAGTWTACAAPRDPGQPERQERGLHGGKKIKGHSRHVAIHSQGTLLAVHVCAANKDDGAEAGAVMVQACERHPSIESFIADTAYKRQAEHIARKILGVELQIVAKPKQPKASAAGFKKGRLQTHPVPLAG